MLDRLRRKPSDGLNHMWSRGDEVMGSSDLTSALPRYWLELLGLTCDGVAGCLFLHVQVTTPSTRLAKRRLPVGGARGGRDRAGRRHVPSSYVSGHGCLGWWR